MLMSTHIDVDDQWQFQFHNLSFIWLIHAVVYNRALCHYVMWEHLSSPNQAKKINWLPSKAALLIALEGSKILI